MSELAVNLGIPGLALLMAMDFAWRVYRSKMSTPGTIANGTGQSKAVCEVTHTALQKEIDSDRISTKETFERMWKRWDSEKQHREKFEQRINEQRTHEIEVMAELNASVRKLVDKLS